MFDQQCVTKRGYVATNQNRNRVKLPVESMPKIGIRWFWKVRNLVPVVSQSSTGEPCYLEVTHDHRARPRRVRCRFGGAVRRGAGCVDLGFMIAANAADA